LIPFCQNFCMVFSSILQNNGLKPKIFWVKWGTKHTLNEIWFSILETKCPSPASFDITSRNGLWKLKHPDLVKFPDFCWTCVMWSSLVLSFMPWVPWPLAICQDLGKKKVY
jgi:hypothetical protein